MREAATEGRRFTAVLPAVAAAAVSGWAYWCFAAPAPPPGPVAVAGGVLLAAGACAAYWVRVRGSGGFFGALLLGMGLLLTVAAVEQATARGAVATCVVEEVRTRIQESFGEGAPPTKTLYRHVLRCPGGYPAELKGDRPVAAEGEEVRVAYDPGRRVSPEREGQTTPVRAVVGAVLLLALSTVIARVASRTPPD
ncbi:hypothetical protein ACFWUZ_12655 [Streptomyces sp. NPDC058646]|uniref:hypothetical protein n=1 Tax=Streptomyces sp. NPDC058646 TaxID=3346574 RepID=UPI003652BC9F